MEYLMFFSSIIAIYLAIYSNVGLWVFGHFCKLMMKLGL